MTRAGRERVGTEELFEQIEHPRLVGEGGCRGRAQTRWADSLNRGSEDVDKGSW